VDRGEFLWERIKHDDALFASRSEFFLLGQSVLVAAGVLVVASTSISAGDRRLIALLVAGLSIVTIAIWIWTSLRHLWVRDALYAALTDSGPVFQPVSGGRRVPRPGAHVLMGVILPSGFLVLWIVLPIATW
jgi:hypothetical protein